MGKKLLSWLFVAGFFLLSLALAVGILFAGPSEAGANERLSDTPALTDRDGNFNVDILSDTSAWFSDHFFGRQELISMNNWLTAKLFGTSWADDVIYGADGWLYYGSTLEDFTGTNQMSDREIYSVAKNLALMAEYCREQGRGFAFMIAPNKNSLYPEYMPDYGVTADTRDAQRLHAKLAELGVNYIDLYAAFGAQDEPLYFAHDSHWNSKGAALGADAVNAAFGRVSNYFGGDFSQTQPHAGDLYEMMYPAFTDRETDPLYGGTLSFTYESNATKPDSITLLTQGQGKESLLCYRDSFGNLLYPYLADSFGAARFSRSTTYDLTQAGDYVLIELVERNLDYLLNYLPVMTAPERDITLPEASGTATAEISTPKSPEGTFLVEGTLPETADADSPIYILSGGKAFEAFCMQNGSFGAYLLTQTQPDGVACYVGGELRLFTIQ